jgi:ATP phosphoribosyltransferase regulatory subunit
MNWLLPEYLADALPAEAARIESLRRRCSIIFAARFRAGHAAAARIPRVAADRCRPGSAAQDLKLVDQLSGRTMGVRADITPQVRASMRTCSITRV